MLDPVDPAFVRLVAESTILFGGYLFNLLFIMKQKSVYMGLLRQTGLWPVGSQRTDAEKVWNESAEPKSQRRLAGL